MVANPPSNFADLPPGLDAGIVQREDLLREFEERLAGTNQAIRTGLTRRQQHADAMREARARVEELTRQAHALDATDPAKAQRAREKRQQKRAAYKEAEQGFQAENARCQQLQAEQQQLEQAIGKLMKLRQRARWQRMRNRLRGMHEEDDSGATANVHVPAVALAAGIVGILVIVLLAVRYRGGSSTREDSQRGVVAQALALFTASDDAEPPSPEASAAVAAAQLKAMGISTNLAAASAEPLPPPADRAPAITRLARVTDVWGGPPRGPLLQPLWGSPIVYSRPSNTIVLFTDVTGDGIVECIMREPAAQRVAIYAKSNAEPDYILQHQIDIDASSEDLHLADVTGDGAIDMLVAHTRHVSALWLLRNRGDGTFEREILSTGRSHWRVETRDLNSDGIPEIIGTGYTGTWIYVGREEGRFAPPHQVDAAPRQNDLVIADFNEDGQLDVATLGTYHVNAPPEATELHLVLLDAKLAPLGESKTQRFAPALMRLSAIDLDGKAGADLVGLRHKPGKRDGRGDLIYDVILLWNSGSGRFDPVKCGETQTGNALCVMDLNGDGLDDLIGANRAFLNEAGRRLSAQADSLTGAYPWHFQRVDVDNDGRLDLVSSLGGRQVGVYLTRP